MTHPLALVGAALGAVALSPAALQKATPVQTAPLPMARCELGNANGETYKGPCVFTLGAKGSFSVARPGNARVIDDDVLVLVTMVRPGVADVTSRTRAGTTLNWGRATRATTSTACWRGTDFWICVYALTAPPAPGAGSPPSRPGTTAPSRR